MPYLELLDHVGSLDNEVTAQPFFRFATNDVFNPYVWAFDEDGTDSTQLTTRAGLSSLVTIPEGYDSAPVFELVWGTTKTTGSAVWDIDYRIVNGDATESLDQTGQTEALSVTDAAAGTALYRLVPTAAATASFFTGKQGATLLVNLFRDGVHASDTLAGAALLFRFRLNYAVA